MSGYGYNAPCPNCGGSLDCYSDHKPFDYVFGQCYDCGFYYDTKSGQLTLDELNELRDQMNEENEYVGEDYLQPLKELPELKVV